MRRTANITKKDKPSPPAGMGDLRAEIRRLTTELEKRDETIRRLEHELEDVRNGRSS